VKKFPRLTRLALPAASHQKAAPSLLATAFRSRLELQALVAVDVAQVVDLQNKVLIREEDLKRCV